jgi:type 1 glutamine amidotransferase
MKKCLIVSGGWEGHRPFEAGERVRNILEECEFEVRHSQVVSSYEEEDLEDYDLIVPNWTVGELSAEGSKKLRAAIESGVGLGGFHGGMADGFRGSDDFRFMVGGAYVAEPGSIRRYKVEISKPEDPIFSGVADFEYESEQYYMLVDPGVEVLAVTCFDDNPYPWINGVVMPTVWRKKFGQGNVFFSALGHVPDEFEHEAMRQILRRGLLWASR